jgi:hypothetical protein
MPVPIASGAFVSTAASKMIETSSMQSMTPATWAYTMRLQENYAGIVNSEGKSEYIPERRNDSTHSADGTSG